VTTVLSSTATELLAAAGGGVIATLASAEPLRPAEPTLDATAAEIDGTAVVAPFTGAATGELLLIVDDRLGAALHGAEVGSLDVLPALTPVLEAAATAIGTVVLGPAQLIDPKLALRRVLGHSDAAVLPLQGSSGVQAAVAIGVDTAATAAPAAAPVDRLDLLRGVEMAATAELGRARMTVNDLLSLRTGAVIELDRSAGAPADLYVNGRLIARGEVVVVDENYGLRITQVVTDDTIR
jgi:flagellar motor switch protein FliN/FliY